jgi:hypothetical protein
MVDPSTVAFFPAIIAVHPKADPTRTAETAKAPAATPALLKTFLTDIKTPSRTKIPAKNATGSILGYHAFTVKNFNEQDRLGQLFV